MSVNNNDYRIGPSSRGYLKARGRFYTGSIRLLFIFVVYFNFLIYANGQLVDKVKYYDVTGGTAEEFTQNWHRIQRTLGFRGLCEWQPKMNHSHIQTRWGYKPSILNLKVYVTLTLPRFKYPYSMPSVTKDWYNRQLQMIYNHEYKHRAFKIEFYNQFIRDYNRLPAYRSVDALYGATNQLLWRHYNNTKAKDAQFDKNWID